MNSESETTAGDGGNNFTPVRLINTIWRRVGGGNNVMYVQTASAFLFVIFLVVGRYFHRKTFRAILQTLSTKWIEVFCSALFTCVSFCCEALLLSFTLT